MCAHVSLIERHICSRRYEMAEDPEEAAEADARGRQPRRPGLVPRFHVLLTTFEMASKVQRCSCCGPPLRWNSNAGSRTEWSSERIERMRCCARLLVSSQQSCPSASALPYAGPDTAAQIRLVCPDHRRGPPPQVRDQPGVQHAVQPLGATLRATALGRVASSAQLLLHRLLDLCFHTCCRPTGGAS